MEGAREGGVDTLLRCMARLGVNPVSSEQGAKALLVAAGNGHGAILTLLLQNGASLAGVDDEGNSPLHVAILCGQVACVRVLSAKDELRRKGNTQTGQAPEDMERMVAQSGPRPPQWVSSARGAPPTPQGPAPARGFESGGSPPNAGGSLGGSGGGGGGGSGGGGGGSGGGSGGGGGGRPGSGTHHARSANAPRQGKYNRRGSVDSKDDSSPTGMQARPTAASSEVVAEGRGTSVDPGPGIATPPAPPGGAAPGSVSEYDKDSL